MSKEHDYSMNLAEGVDDADVAFIRTHLRDYNDSLSEYHRLTRPVENGPQPLQLYMRDEDQHIHGGLIAMTHWKWLDIDLLWLDESIRNKGYGTRLIQEAEKIAIKRGCLWSRVSTYSFQAPEFYQKLGYEVWGVVENYPPGHNEIFLKKTLVMPQ